jgi:hypothetical protein
MLDNPSAAISLASEKRQEIKDMIQFLEQEIIEINARL